MQLDCHHGLLDEWSTSEVPGGRHVHIYLDFNASTVRRVQVVWPSGRVEEWTHVAADQWLTLTEGTGRTRP